MESTHALGVVYSLNGRNMKRIKCRLILLQPDQYHNTHNYALEGYWVLVHSLCKVNKRCLEYDAWSTQNMCFLHMGDSREQQTHTCMNNLKEASLQAQESGVCVYCTSINVLHTVFRYCYV